MQRSWVFAVGVSMLLAGGCGGDSKIAPVSGVVTLNGKPAPEVALTFQPVANGNNAPGPSAFAVTGTDGRYTAKLMGEEKNGATVGKNIVRFAGYVPVDLNYDGRAKTKPKTNSPP